MEFVKDGKKVKLVVEKPASNKLVPSSRLSKVEVAKGSVFMMQLIPIHQKELCCAIKGEDDNEAPEEAMITR